MTFVLLMIGFGTGAIAGAGEIVLKEPAGSEAASANLTKEPARAETVSALESENPALPAGQGIVLPGRRWHYPRKSSRNTASSGFRADFTSVPQLDWTFQMDYIDAGTYPVAGDLDGNGSVELVVGDASGVMYCLDGRTGLLRWRTELPSFFKWGSPVLVDLDQDQDLEILVGALDLYALDGTTGAVIWRSLENVDILGMSADDLDGDGTIEIFCTDYLVPRHGYLVRGEDGAVLWTAVTDGSTYNIPAFWDIDGDGRKEILCTRHGDGLRERVICLDSQDGEERWHYQCGPDPIQLLMAPPELGYMVDYGYQSVALADFDGDGEMEISSGTDLNHYLLELDGSLVWKTRQGILGNGFTRVSEPDGSTTYGNHHYQIYDQAVADLDGDGGTDMVYGLISDYILNYHRASGKTGYRYIEFRNRVRAIRGSDGSELWTFDGIALGAGRGRTWDPVIADLDGDHKPEVLISSEDNFLYALEGEDGSLLWRLPLNYIGLSRGKIVVDVDGDRLGELIIVAGRRVMMFDGP